MKRRLFNILAAVTLMLCVATVVLWARSYWYEDSIGYFRAPDGVVGASSREGSLGFGIGRQSNDESDVKLESEPIRVPEYVFFDLDDITNWQFLGFAYGDGQQHPKIPIWFVSVPHWFFVVLTATVFWLLLRRSLCARRRLKMNLCFHCGYDLRASKDRCPECGTAIASPSAEGGVA